MLSVFSLNVNSDRRPSDEKVPKTKHIAAAFPEYRDDKRACLLAKFMLEKRYDIYGLCELSVKMRQFFTLVFGNENYLSISAPYNTDDDAFQYLVAYNPKRLTMLGFRQIYITKSGLPTLPGPREKMNREARFSAHFGVEYERSFPIITFLDLTTGSKFVYVAAHPGLPNEHRLIAITMLCDSLSAEKLPIIIAGDMNQFDASKKKEDVIYTDQVAILTKNGFDWSSECLALKGAKATFKAYPYDIERFFNKKDFEALDKLKVEADSKKIKQFYLDKKVNKLSTCLDAVFAKNVKVNNLACETYAGGKIIDTSKTIRQEIEDITEMLPSDHFALTFDFAI